MRRAAAITLTSLLVFACNKKAADLASAEAAPSPAAPKPAADNAPVDETPPPGVDLSQLDQFERKVFFRIVNRESSACGKAHSLLVSVKTDPGCRKSFYAVKSVVKQVDSGHTDTEVSEYLTKRFRGAARRSIDIAEAPMKGNASARISLVEFVDYECPHCKRVQPVLRQAVDEFRNDVRVYFKHYPLGSHSNARLAAEAAVAAQKQGKFWEYSDQIWANAESLTPAKLEQIAKDVGLDVARWRKDLESDAVRNRVQKDRNDGSGLGIQSTPTIYLNGREYTDTRDIDSLRDWIAEELGR